MAAAGLRSPLSLRSHDITAGALIVLDVQRDGLGRVERGVDVASGATQRFQHPPGRVEVK